MKIIKKSFTTIVYCIENRNCKIELKILQIKAVYIFRLIIRFNKKLFIIVYRFEDKNIII
jgi:hypothetical protein